MRAPVDKVYRVPRATTGQAVATALMAVSGSTMAAPAVGSITSGVVATAASAAYVGIASTSEEAAKMPPSASTPDPALQEIKTLIGGISAKLDASKAEPAKPPWFKRTENYALAVSLVTLLLLTFGLSDRFNEVNRRVTSLEGVVRDGFTEVRKSIDGLHESIAVDRASRGAQPPPKS